jgi:hypothetical protein
MIKLCPHLKGAIVFRGRTTVLLLSGSMIWAWSSTAWADAAQTRRPCGFSNLAVELYAQGGVIRPDLTDAMFSSPARTTTSGTAEQDFSARGSDIGFNTPWMPIIEGGAIVFPCRFFGIGVHGGGSWSGVPDGQPVSTQLAQRTASQITMMRMALSLHGQLPISRYFLLRASALVGYRSYSDCRFREPGSERPWSSSCRSSLGWKRGCVCRSGCRSGSRLSLVERSLRSRR